ncbi:carbon starvation CstA family protein [Streptomyces sp. NPDC002520]
MTISIALLMGFCLHFLRSGRVVETGLMGVAPVLFAMAGGGWWVESSSWAQTFTWAPTILFLCLVGCGFVASVLPVRMLPAPGRRCAWPDRNRALLSVNWLELAGSYRGWSRT